MTVVATAGHVDHGKSTLVRALTGTDPDRWAEEKERGLTIDLGFARALTPSGAELELVDVPGHVRFLKNMLAGVGGVQAALLVVAATEGWKPQSEEHLRILDLLGVGRSVVAVTHAGLAGDVRASEVARDAASRLVGTALAGSEVVAVDSVTGEGLPDLWTALDRMLTTTPPAPDRGVPRLWIDRVFSATGAGVVVTGTLTGGSLEVGTEVLAGSRPARVRSLQRHGQAVDATGPGHRVAVNLAGADRGHLARGVPVVRAGQWHWTKTFDADLSVLAGLDHPVTRRGAFTLHVGSGEHPVAVRVIGAAGIEPGSTGCVRVHLPRPLPLVPGDRFVLRESGRAETVGGGRVLDVDPVLPASRARPDDDPSRVVRERGWVEVGLLRRLTGEKRLPDVGRWAVDPDELSRARSQLRARVEESGSAGLDLAPLDERERAVIAGLEGIEVSGGRARLAGLDNGEDPWLEAARSQPFSPPPPEGVDRARLRRLVESGAVVESDGVHFAAEAVAAAARVVAGLLESRPEGVTASAARQALGTSRKYALPLLAALDRSGVTRRRGDVRLGGPRLPRQDKSRSEPNL